MTQFDFDLPIDRRNTNCVKWDMLEPIYGVSPDDGISMWVADMDFSAPPVVNEALQAAVDHGVHGYYGDDRAYKQAIINWMKTRHDWQVEPDWISTTHGLVAAVGTCLQAYSAPGDGIILFTPVYHAFAKMVRANKREIVESRLKNTQGRYEMDLDALAAQLTGREKMVILCSPHNPGGRVWSKAELQALAAFCKTHDLILISDEVHHDLVFPGQTHTVMPNAAPDCLDRMVMLTASSKTFNLAGGMTGNAIIPDNAMRAKFMAVHLAAGVSPNRFGMIMATTAYTHGLPWLEALLDYLGETKRQFDSGMNAIPGVRSMTLGATYLAWVDFSGTGMDAAEFTARVEKTAKVVGNHGPTFGSGGETFLRFNIAMPRARVLEAVGRMQDAFADLQ